MLWKLYIAVILTILVVVSVAIFLFLKKVSEAVMIVWSRDELSAVIPPHDPAYGLKPIPIDEWDNQHGN